VTPQSSLAFLLDPVNCYSFPPIVTSTLHAKRQPVFSWQLYARLERISMETIMGRGTSTDPMKVSCVSGSGRPIYMVLPPNRRCLPWKGCRACIADLPVLSTS
jgi:hypothetical protein